MWDGAEEKEDEDDDADDDDDDDEDEVVFFVNDSFIGEEQIWSYHSLCWSHRRRKARKGFEKRHHRLDGAHPVGKRAVWEGRERHCDCEDVRQP